MTNEDNKSSFGGVVGAAIVGAAVGATAVLALNKDTRKKVHKKIVEGMEMGEKKLDDLERKVNEMRASGEEKINERVDQKKKELKSKL